MKFKALCLIEFESNNITSAKAKLKEITQEIMEEVLYVQKVSVDKSDKVFGKII